LISARVSQASGKKVKNLKGFYKGSTVCRLFNLTPQQLFNFIAKKESLVGVIINDEEMLVHPHGVLKLVASNFRRAIKADNKFIEEELKRRANALS